MADTKALTRRRFTQDEVERIVRRAAELQQRPESLARVPQTSSLQEIERLAGDLGLAPEQVRAAALDLYAPAVRSRSEKIFGGPLALRLSRTVPGTAGTERLESLLKHIQRTMGETGQVALVGRTLTWIVHRHP